MPSQRDIEPTYWMPERDAIEGWLSRMGLLFPGLFLLGFYAILFLSFPSEPVFWSPDEGGRYLDMRRIAELGGFRGPLPYPGESLDGDLRHVPLQYFRVEEGRIFSWWPSIFPALSSLPYRLFGFRGIYLLPLLSGLLVSLGVYRLVGDARPSWRLAATAAAGLASPLFFYGFTFWEHNLAALLVLLASSQWVRGLASRSPTRLAIGGALLALATGLRVEAIVFGLAFGLVGFAVSLNGFRRRWKICAVFLCAAATPVLLAADGLDRYYQLGKRLTEAHWRGMEGLGDLVIGSRVHGGFDFEPRLKWVAILIFLGVMVSPWLGRRLSAGMVAAWVGLSMLPLLETSRYISMHGVALSLPYVALLTSSLRAEEQETRFWGWIGLSSLAGYLTVSMFFGWEGQGGLQWGPRYALPLSPIVIIAVFRGTLRAPRSVKLALSVLCIVGFGLEARGLMVMRASRSAYQQWQGELLALPEDSLLLTSSPILALTLPRVYERRVLLRLDRDQPIPAAPGWSPICRVEVDYGRLQVHCEE